MALVCAAAACGSAPPFPRELLERTDREPDLKALLREPERSAGRLVMLGGAIVETRNLRNATEVEVLQQPLDSEGRPRTGDTTAGRFLIATPRLLDAAVHHRGRNVTVIGETAGTTERPLGAAAYRYLVLKETAYHLWPPSTDPRFSVGIGRYHGF